MADYYTNTVITSSFRMTEDLVRILEMRGATVHPDGEPETILDGIVKDRVPLRAYHVTFEQGFDSTLGGYYESIEEWADEEGEDLDSISDYVKEHALDDEPDILHEILKLNPDEPYIEMQSGWGCSKMRIDGFGGSSLHVSRKGYMYVTTTEVTVEDDGTIKFGGEFQLWDKEEVEREAA